MAVVTESVTGASFPKDLSTWDGQTYRNLGAAPRVMKVAMIKVKVYAVALFVPERILPAPANGTVPHLCGGTHDRVLQWHLVRNISGEQFVDALNKNLAPHMGTETAPLQQFKDALSKRKLNEGTVVTMLLTATGTVEVVISSPGASTDLSQAKPELVISSPRFCSSILTIYFEANSVVPDAAKTWINGAVHG